MAELPEIRKHRGAQHRRVHMANERTYLAWIRTSIAIMAFGFVVEKFSLFVKEVGYYVGKEIAPPPPGYSSKIGILLVGLGVVIGGLAFVRYRVVEQQIDDDTYAPSPVLSVVLFASVLVIGVLLLVYLIHGI
jgi:putative membrane protein